MFGIDKKNSTTQNAHCLLPTTTTATTATTTTTTGTHITYFCNCSLSSYVVDLPEVDFESASEVGRCSTVLVGEELLRILKISISM